MNAGGSLQVVVPDGIEDPGRPSGGNTYDRLLCEHLAADGWSVAVRGVAGDWPWAGQESRQALEHTLGGIPDDSLVLVDGLVASAVPEVMVPASRRLRVVVLMHMPIGRRGADDDSWGREGAVVGEAAAVVTTSAWSRDWLLESYGLDPARVHVARPGVEPAARAQGSEDGRRLLCVGAVTPVKGHDLLLAALTRIADLEWRCLCVGTLTRAGGFVEELSRDIRSAGLDDRIVLTGSRTGAELEATYADADLLVLASRAETYGMVVTEALARGVPVVAPGVGGVPEALGETSGGQPPGLLLPPGDPDALADSLRWWLSDPDLRWALREAAARRRAALGSWPETASRVADVLAEVAR